MISLLPPIQFILVLAVTLILLNDEFDYVTPRLLMFLAEKPKPLQWCLMMEGRGWHFFLIKSQIVNIFGFVGLWSLWQRLRFAVAWNQPQSICKWVGVAVSLQNFIDKNRQTVRFHSLATVSWPLLQVALGPLGPYFLLLLSPAPGPLISTNTGSIGLGPFIGCTIQNILPLYMWVAHVLISFRFLLKCHHQSPPWPHYLE